jgi:hypothetical protein
MEGMKPDLPSQNTRYDSKADAGNEWHGRERAEREKYDFVLGLFVHVWAPLGNTTSN